MKTAFVYSIQDIAREDPFDWYNRSGSRELTHICEDRVRRKEVKMMGGLGLPLFYAVACPGKNHFSKKDFEFFTPDRKPVRSLDGFLVIQRSYSNHSYSLIDSISKRGGIPAVSCEEEKRII